MHYRDADDEYFKVFSESSDSLAASIGRTKYPKTYRAMFGFCVKINSLKTAMFECIESNNPYAFKVLFRCFCEHHLKFMYIWTCFISENSDRIGSEYFSFCGAIEAQEYATAIAMTEKILGNEVVTNTKNIIAQIYPEAAHLSNSELKSRAGQLKYRKILHFLSDEKYALIAKENSFLAHIAPTYALLSSFVHGGPYSDLEMSNFSHPSAIAECNNDMEVATLMAATTFMLTTAAISKEHSEFRNVAKKIDSVIKRFLAENS